jgi:hypothetical protein
MSKRTMALAAVLLACGIGTASAQGQVQGHGQGSGQQRTAMPPYTHNPQTSDTVPMRSHVAEPTVNPSAAGTLKEREGHSATVGTDDINREHSGSVGANANTHPLESLKAGRKPREEGITAPPAIQPTPHSTMNRDAGR